MKLIVPDYYSKFQCIDSDCTDSCCSGWEVDVDEASYRYYESVTGKFGDRLHSVMSREGGCHFTLLPDKRCPFLNDRGLCDLFTELGEDKLCKTCAMYPRFVHEYGSVREMGIALSCKTAAELILTYRGSAGFITTEDNEPVTSYNDIDPELYFALLFARDTAYSLVQNGAYCVRERIALLLAYAAALQHLIDKHEYSRIKKLSCDYSSKEKLASTLNELKRKYCGSIKDGEAEASTQRYNHMGALLNAFDSLEPVKKEFYELIEENRKLFKRIPPECGGTAGIGGCCRADDYNDKVSEYNKAYNEFYQYYSDRMYEFEHIMVYYIFRYFLEAVYDYNLLDKVKLGAVGYLMTLELDVTSWKADNKTLTTEEQIEIVHLYSREVEHSDENFAALEKMYGSDAVFSADKLISSILS